MFTDPVTSKYFDLFILIIIPVIQTHSQVNILTYFILTRRSTLYETGWGQPVNFFRGVSGWSRTIPKPCHKTYSKTYSGSWTMYVPATIMNATQHSYLMQPQPMAEGLQF